MKFISRTSPNYRDKKSTLSIMIELTLALLILMFASVYYYAKTVNTAVGLRVIYVTLVAVLVNIVIEVVFGHFRKLSVKQVFTQEFPWVTGLIFALAVPVTTNLYVVAMTTAIGVLFAKVIFGGFGQNIFNPAGIGRAIVFSSFAKPVADKIANANDIFTKATPANLMNSFNWLPSAAALDSKAFAHITMKDLAFGSHFGTIGETFAIIIIVLGVLLAIRKVIDWRIPVVYVGTLFIGSWIIGLVNGLGIWYPLMFVMSGGVLFGAVFMLTDPVTCPTQVTGRVIFALGAAIITMLIRYKANLPEGVVFSILIMNMLTPVIEDALDGVQTLMKKQYLTTTIAIAAVAALSTTWIALSSEIVEPEIDLGTPVTFAEEKLDKYDAEIIASEPYEDNSTKYLVSVEGYGLKDAQYPNPAYKENVFAIVVKDNKIITAWMEEFGDTKNIGDLVDDSLYFEKFSGKDLLNDSEEYDTVSSATITSYSFIKALRTVSDELGA